MNELSRIEPQQTQALAVRENGNLALGQPLSVTDISQRLGFIKQVMETVMRQGVDYGKVPGCGDKPGLFQPGAQKLCLTFQLNSELQTEKVIDMPNYHREYSVTVRVSSGSKHADGVGVCSTLESKYRFRGGERLCPTCGKPTIIKGKAEYGGGWLCFAKKGGCGAKYQEGDPAIEKQQVGRVENDSVADCWNTVRKMAFKRAFVHAVINFTNTSELWSQDLEDMAQNGNTPEDDHREQEPPRPANARTNGHKPSNIQQAPPQTPPIATQFVQAKKPTEKTRQYVVDQLLTVLEPTQINGYLIATGILQKDETFEVWPLDKLPFGQTMPAMTQAISDLGLKIQAWWNAQPAQPELATK